MTKIRCEFNSSVLVRCRKIEKRLSEEKFLKELHAYSNGECSMSRSQYRKLESGEEKIQVNPYKLAWVCRFTGISPNEFFNWKK